MSYTLEIIYSKAFTRSVMREQWVKGYFLVYSYYLSIPLLALLLWFSTGESSIAGGRGWITGFLTGSIGTCFGLLGWWYLHVRKRMRNVKDQIFLYEFNEEGIKYSDSETSAFFKWSVVRGLERKQNYWLLHLQEEQAALPLESLNQEILAFILSSLGQEKLPVHRHATPRGTTDFDRV